MNTWRPVNGIMIEAAARAVWAKEPGLNVVEWDAVPYPFQQIFRTKARVALEAAFPQDKEFLLQFARECEEVANRL